MGVSSHAEECEALLARLDGLDYPQHDVDVVLQHTALTMSRALLGDVAGSTRHLHRGAAEADRLRLRLRLLRAQLRWAEFGLAAWHGTSNGPELLRLAIEAHRRTELYELGILELATNLLGFDTGHVVEWPQSFQVHEDLTWAAVEADFAGDTARADELVAQRLAVRGPAVWLTLGHLTVLGHVVADLGLAHHAARVIERLTPDRDHLAMVGQVASCGPVALALARLRTVAGDLEGARSDLALADELVRRNDGGPSRLRCTIARAEIDRAGGRQVDAAGLLKVVADARRLGLERVALRAEELLDGADAVDLAG